MLRQLAVSTFAAIALLSFTGCTHLRTLGALNNYSEINEQTRGEKAVVTLASGHQLRVRALHIAPDVTTWIDPATDMASSVPTADLRSVEIISHADGLVEGFKKGLAVGLGVGAMTGFIVGDETYVGPGLGAVVGAGMFALPGAGVGSLYGLAHGTRYEYVLW